uniref:C2H2-type domain-containing protein n=1 Tax=Parascaris univalens TaxID=6257 RepID=A0A915ATN0_PARUN
SKMYRKGAGNAKKRRVAHSARGTSSAIRRGTGTRRTTTRAASVQPSVPPADVRFCRNPVRCCVKAGRAPCKVESETTTPHCLSSVLSVASPSAGFSLRSLTEELYEGGNVKEPFAVSVKLEQSHDDADLHHAQLDQADLEIPSHSSLDPARSTSDASFERSPGLQCSDFIMTCRSPCKEDILPLDMMMFSTSSTFDRSHISGSSEVDPKRLNQNVTLEGSVGVKHTPNANHDEYEAAIVTLPERISAVKVTKRSRQDMMLEEPVVKPSARRTKAKVSRRISAFNRSSLLRSPNGKDESRQSASLPEQQHRKLSCTECPIENSRITADLPSEPSTHSVALRIPEQGREVADNAAEGVCGSSVAACKALLEIPFVTCFDEEPPTEQGHNSESQEIAGNAVEQLSLQNTNNSFDLCAVFLEDDVNCATGKEASSEKDGQLEEGEIIEDDDANVSESVNMDNSASELTMKRSAHRKRSRSSSSCSSREGQLYRSGCQVWFTHSCMYCIMVFDKLSERLYHEISRHRMQQCYCRACDSTFSEARMDVHLRKSHRSQLRCFCGFKAESRWKLAQHKEDDHNISCF